MVTPSSITLNVAGCRIEATFNVIELGDTWRGIVARAWVKNKLDVMRLFPSAAETFCAI